MTIAVRYSRWRAIGAIAFPLVLLAIPAVNFVVNPADFRMRWLDEWFSTLMVGLAIVWFVYALWPSAFRLLSGGPDEVRTESDSLVFSTGERHNLRELSAVEILRPWLQHPRIALSFPSGWVMIETAYQALGERKSVEAIASGIAQAARK